MKNEEKIGSQNPIQERLKKYRNGEVPIRNGVPKEHAYTPIGELPIKYKKNFEWLLGKNWWITDADKLREKGYDPRIYMFAEDGEVVVRSDLNCWDDDLSHWEDAKPSMDEIAGVWDEENDNPDPDWNRHCNDAWGRDEKK